MKTITTVVNPTNAFLRKSPTRVTAPCYNYSKIVFIKILVLSFPYPSLAPGSTKPPGGHQNSSRRFRPKWPNVPGFSCSKSKPMSAFNTMNTSIDCARLPAIPRHPAAAGHQKHPQPHRSLKCHIHPKNVQHLHSSNMLPSSVQSLLL